ncbi:MAG: nucleotide sugar dehydrogenase, partial [Candidatus Omnitrophica bacterium]|nr:nucleotide sugar dehydrogenase [Candidatus Omnitrophota bacterium]
PIAVEFSKKGFFVYGYDTKESRIEGLKKGKSHIDDIKDKDIKSVIKKGFNPTYNAKVLNNSDVIIVCVPTPLRNKRTPDISYIIKVTKAVSKYLHVGQLIVLESTTYPGTTREIMLPMLEKGGLKEGKDFFLAFSPERIDPGNKKYKFSNIPKIVGGISKTAGELTKRLYSKVVDKVVYVSRAESAEVVKLLENTFRIVNIGLINEFAMLCDKLGIDVWEVIEAAKTKPFGFMPFYPGPGVGGHCISTDPLYLSWKAKRLGFKTRMIDLASKTNLSMPDYVVEKVIKLLEKKQKSINKAKILILGVTYKENIKDLRESPALDIIDILTKKKAKVSYADPYIPYLDIDNIKLKATKITKANIGKHDIVVLVTSHTKFNYSMIASNAKLIFDTRNGFAKAGISSSKIIQL